MAFQLKTPNAYSLEHWCGAPRKKALANDAKAGEQNILHAGLRPSGILSNNTTYGR
jgi:hypothetical protein